MQLIKETIPLSHGVLENLVNWLREKGRSQNAIFYPPALRPRPSRERLLRTHIVSWHRQAIGGLCCWSHDDGGVAVVLAYLSGYSGSSVALGCRTEQLSLK